MLTPKLSPDADFLFCLLQWWQRSLRNVSGSSSANPTRADPRVSIFLRLSLSHLICICNCVCANASSLKFPSRCKQSCGPSRKIAALQGINFSLSLSRVVNGPLYLARLFLLPDWPRRRLLVNPPASRWIEPDTSLCRRVAFFALVCPHSSRLAN